MTTTMHRLQISLPEQLFRYLAGRARQDGVSMAEVIRRLLDAAAEGEGDRPTPESLLLGETRPAYHAGPPALLGEVILHLPPDFYQCLRQEADRAGKLVPTLRKSGWPNGWPLRLRRSSDERARVTEVLRAAGMLAELGPRTARPCRSYDQPGRGSGHARSRRR